MVGIALACVTALSFLHSRRLGAVVFLFAAVGSSVPYWAVPPIEVGHSVTTAYNSFPALPDWHFSPSISGPLVPSDMIVPAFSSLAVMSIFALEFRRTKRLLCVSLLLLLPSLLYVLEILNGTIMLGMQWPYLIISLVCAGIGLLGTSIHFLSTPQDV
jgi:hypothetical protein